MLSIWYWFRRTSFKRATRFWWQRQLRGWDDSDTWNLDRTFAKFVLPRLVRFKELHDGYPGHLTPETWNVLLDQMIKAFKLIVADDYFYYGSSTEEEIEAGLELFRQYYSHLWW